ncbi:MAG: tRNA uridine-5-carboxymethylaminomethyl(34) synthesis GTPase MnmE [Hyphomicrobiales bacterium]
MANDTIVALATAPGESAVAVVRLSGPAALAIAALRFRGKRSPETVPGHRILLGRFVDDDGAALDSVLLSVFRAPRSYTGEDVVEISSHGGAAVPRAIVEALVRSGARPARPGEFTERAFRNGKIDLSQAEAVAALVRARSERAARAAEAALGGALGRRVDALDGELIALSAEVEARIDFPIDVGEAIDGAALAARCAAVGERIAAWTAAIPSARRRDEGVRVALVGAPNVGKSSLLNALVGYDRAIVSEAPGTTRDTVEASIWLDGVELRLIDTAGWRGASDPVERLGVERTERALADADVVVLVLDRSRPEALESGMGPDAETEAGPRALGPRGDRATIVAWNKADLAPAAAGAGRARRAAGDAPSAERHGTSPHLGRASLLAGPPPLAEIETVAIRPGGADALLAALRDALPRVLGGHGGEEIPTTSARQEALLTDALEALRRAAQGLRDDASYDLVAVDLADARRALGEVVGRGVAPDVAAAVFSRFCIGK